MKLEISNLQKFVPIDPRWVKKVVSAGTEAVDADISISVVDDASIQKINREHLGHDFPTDVLAFDYREGGRKAHCSGEIIVSAETADRVAREEDRDAVEELALYIIHGLLHLQDFDDKDGAGAAAMRDRQNRIMASLGYAGDLSP